MCHSLLGQWLVVSDAKAGGRREAEVESAQFVEADMARQVRDFIQQQAETD